MKHHFLLRILVVMSAFIFFACNALADLSDKTLMNGQKTRYIRYRGDKVAEIKVHEQIRREGQELRSKAISRVEMWADGVGELNFSFRANARVKGSANKNSTAPPGARFLNVQRNRVTYTANLVAYAGGTQKTVSRFSVPFTQPVNRSFSLSGHGNASHYIGWTETPEAEINNLDPEAWAEGDIINSNEHFAPGSVTIESEGNVIDNAFVSSGNYAGSLNGNSGSSTGCSNNETYNYCNDQGSCSVGSGPGVPGPQCGENYCCCP